MNELEQAVLTAKTDERSLNSLIRSQKQWILRCASECTHRNITDNDDEWSVALLAFSEAVDRFDETKGPFLPFAGAILRGQLVDFLRSEGRPYAEIPVNPAATGAELTEAALSGVPPQDGEAEEAARIAGEPEDADPAGARAAAIAREEASRMQAVLGRYGFSFYDLAECSPKAEKTRKYCAAAVRSLLRDEDLMRQMRRTRMLPMKELSAGSGIPRRILDRHRRYLIAAAEILAGEYPALSAYMDFIRKV